MRVRVHRRAGQQVRRVVVLAWRRGGVVEGDGQAVEQGAVVDGGSVLASLTTRGSMARLSCSWLAPAGTATFCRPVGGSGRDSARRRCPSVPGRGDGGARDVGPRGMRT